MEHQQDLLIVGIENPLLDISVQLPNNDLVDKYGLSHGLACLAEKQHMPLYEEIWNMDGCQRIPGGSSLNTVRSANFMLKDTHPGKCAFFGSIGQDEVGKVLEKELEDNGIHAYFYKTEEEPTGSCAVLVSNHNRTLCANLAACLKYPTSHLEANMQVLEKAALLYTSGFFITSNYEALEKYLKYATETNKPLAANLAATFLIQFHTAQVNKIIEHADFIFCNEDEAKVFAEANKLESNDFKDIALHIQKMPKANAARSRVVCITQGKDPIILAHLRGEEVVVEEIHITPLAKELVIDTNGAGDSFVGGFIS